jgi:ATP-binding cassette, subfamily B, bacterial MsbA
MTEARHDPRGRFGALRSPSLHLLRRTVLGQRRLLAGTLAVNALAALVEGTSFLFLGLAISVLADGQLPSAFASSWFGGILPSGKTPLFLTMTALAVGSQVVRSGLAYLGNVLSVRLGTSARVDYQSELTHRLLLSRYSVLQRLRGGELAEAIIAPSNTIVELVDAVNRLLVYGMMVAVYGAMLLILAPVLTLLAGVIFAFVLYLQRHLVAGVRSAAARAAADNAEMTASVVEQTQALRTVQAFSLQARLSLRSRAIFERMRDSNRQLNKKYFGTQAISESAMLVAIGAFLSLAYFGFNGGAGFSFAEFATFVAILNRLSARCSALQTGYSEIVRRSGLMATADIFLERTEGAAIKHEGSILGPLRDSIKIEDVTFTYPGRVDPALDGVSLQIRAGEAVGLIGQSGAGKSSLADILLGLQQPTRGRVLVDGVDLATSDHRSWTRQIGTVSQDPFLFNGTILENLILVRPDARAELIESSLRMAGAWDFVQALPERELTLVGDRGLKLSGGQRQRLALARALVLEPSILLLDEATSALDSETERAVHDALERLHGRLTLVIIAHRLATVRMCDRLVVMQGGRIVEQGNHEQLVAQAGTYASYWNLQTVQGASVGDTQTQ